MENNRNLGQTLMASRWLVVVTHDNKLFDTSTLLTPKAPRHSTLSQVCTEKKGLEVKRGLYTRMWYFLKNYILLFKIYS